MKMLILDESWCWRRCGAVLTAPPGHRGNDPDGQIRLLTCDIDGTNCAQKQNREDVPFQGSSFSHKMSSLYFRTGTLVCSRRSVETDRKLVSTLKT